MQNLVLLKNQKKYLKSSNFFRLIGKRDRKHRLQLQKEKKTIPTDPTDRKL